MKRFNESIARLFNHYMIQLLSLDVRDFPHAPSSQISCLLKTKLMIFVGTGSLHVILILFSGYENEINLQTLIL